MWWCYSQVMVFKMVHEKIASKKYINLIFMIEVSRNKLKHTIAVMPLPHIDTKSIHIGTHLIRLARFNERVHYPSLLGIKLASWLHKASTSILTMQEVNNIETICDVGCGLGHLAILSSLLFPNCKNVYGIDISQESVDHMSLNWQLNAANLNPRIKLHTVVGDAIQLFLPHNNATDNNNSDIQSAESVEPIDSLPNDLQFDLVVMNAPTIDMQSGIKDAYYSTPDNGRYLLDGILKHCSSISGSAGSAGSDGDKKGTNGCRGGRLKNNGLIFTVDSQACGFDLTNNMLDEYYGNENENWFVLEETKMGSQFLNIYEQQNDSMFKNEINQEWIQSLLDSNRLMIDPETNDFCAMRRCIMIKK